MYRLVNFWLPLVASVHIFLLVRQYIPDIGVCSDISLPPEQYDDDFRVVLARLANADAFNVVSVCEVFVMGLTLANVYSTYAHHQTRGRVQHAVHVILSGLLIVSTLAVRLRHTGMLGCADNDPMCCDNLDCPSTLHTATMPGCASASAAIPVTWSRQSFCPTPCWYSSSARYHASEVECQDVSAAVQAECGGLRGTSDVASCYRYGCSVTVSATPYYEVRLLTANVIVFVCLTFWLFALDND